MTNSLKKQKTKVALALGSGGARGLTLIGVIRWLEENDYEIVSISGTSIGALVGGVYAAGELDAFEEFTRSIRRSQVVSLLDLSWRNDGIFKGDKIINKLTDIVGERTIEELSIPFAAISADISNSEEVKLDSGSLFEAIRASISLPLFFTPFKYDDRKLVDGGIINPVPVDALPPSDAEMVLAVNLCAKPVKPEDSLMSDADADETEEDTALTDKIVGFVENMKDSVKSIGKANWAAYDVINETIDTMQNNIAELRYLKCKPDVQINIPSNTCKILDFDQAKRLIDVGYEQTASAFAEWSPPEKLNQSTTDSDLDSDSTT